MSIRPLFRQTAAVIAVAGLTVATASTEQHRPIILHDPQDGSVLISWWGEPMEFYFIQQSGNLVNWTYLPVFEVGDDDVIAWGFKATASRLFFRLHHTDDPESDLMQSDMDGDGLTAYQEYQHGSDPFNPDTAGDGVFDGIAAKLGTPLSEPEIPAPDPNDTAAPTITLQHPFDAVLLP